ncbi:hypothetical protein [Haloarcula salinisoli]|uniref:hypothetical protein n=1 Tax=Haloarcula salinisoli TaxID=2487746 RepID=UPI001F1AB2D4|nr:hypothetical protein [Halomicroarcula salinisoli]
MPAPSQLVIGALQTGPGPGPQLEPVANPFLNLVGSAIGAFLTTLVVGAILVAVAPDYTERKMATLLDEPISSFLYGFVSLIFFALVIFVLAITIVGIIVAIPLAIVLYVAWAVGGAIAFIAIGERLVGRGDGWVKPLLVGAGINGALTLTGIGGIVTFAIGAAGFGAVLRDYLG